MDINSEPFLFDSYEILSDGKEIRFNYKFKDDVFTEKIILPKEITVGTNQELLKTVLENLHLILGISYYKMYCPKKIITPYLLTEEQSAFWNTVYTKGLGEFFYKNKIDFRNLINFPVSNKSNIKPIQLRQLDKAGKNKFLIGIGGGKDSIVAIELLKKQARNLTGFILDSQDSEPTVQIEVAKAMGIDYLIVKRILDKKIFQSQSSFNGHIPITAVYSFTSLLLAIIYDFSEIVIPNGKSANFGNVNYLGQEINHQWSKSEEFEKLFQEYLRENITPDVMYFSNLRNYSELEIAKRFSSYRKYFPIFSSCNRNFTIRINPLQKRWCGECAKCAFVFAILAAYLSKQEVTTIFAKNLLDDPALIPTYRDLIGKGKMKPFDCVGTFDESIAALRMIKSRGEFKNDAVMKYMKKII